MQGIDAESRDNGEAMAMNEYCREPSQPGARTKTVPQVDDIYWKHPLHPYLRYHDGVFCMAP
jgi:hypothetical protein